jgi:hypothetical protein
MQLDWTDGTRLGVTIAGEPYDHKFCHGVLPYSNAEWATLCQSESTSSLIAGSQAAYAEFGGVSEELQTDRCSTATTGATWTCAITSRLNPGRSTGILPTRTGIASP